MRNFRFIIFCLQAVIFLSCVNKTEDPGHKKFIALAPSIAETVYFLGAEEGLAGVSSGCNYPPEVRNITVAATVSDINLELVVQLKPDIVFILPFQDRFAENLSRMNIRTVTVDQTGLEEILNSFLIIGIELDKVNRAQTVKDSLSGLIKGFKRSKNGMNVLISTSREYGSPVTHVYSTGRKGFLNDIAELIGLANCLDTDIPYPKIAAETIMSIDPDIIIDLVPGNIGLDEETLMKDWEIFSQNKAYENKRIYIFKGDHTTIPGPRIFGFIEELIKKTGL